MQPRFATIHTCGKVAAACSLALETGTFGACSGNLVSTVSEIWLMGLPRQSHVQAVGELLAAG